MADKRTTAPAMGIMGTAPTTTDTQVAADTAQPLRTIFSTESALSLLWRTASPALSQPELVWFADNAAEQVSREARTLASVLESIACMTASDEHSGSFQGTDSTSKLLFSLQNQLSAIAGMGEIAYEASLAVRDLAKKGGVL